jgi:DNA-binding MarR family transcriptional regulator
MEGRGFQDTELFLLHEIVIVLDQLARVQILEPKGMTYPEFLVLMAAREFSGPTQQEVGRFLNMSTSLVSQRVSALVKKGFLIQEAVPENRRKVCLAPTASGADILEVIYREMKDHTDGVFDCMGPNRAAFREALVKIGEGLKSQLVEEC